MILETAQETLHMTAGHIAEFYAHYIQPQLKDDKKKATYIGSAIAVALLYKLYDRVFLPPKQLRHIPRLDYFTYIKSMLKGEDPLYQYRRYFAPLAAQGNGIYVVRRFEKKKKKKNLLN